MHVFRIFLGWRHAVMLTAAVYVTACARTPALLAVPPTLAIVDVTVIDVRAGARVPSQTVLVRGNTIVAVGPSSDVRPPDGATVVPGAGKVLIPGLWDMHTHAASTSGRMPRFWALFRAHGITSTREMGNDAASLRQGRAEADAFPDRAPRIVWSSPMLDGDPPTYESATAVAGADAGRRLAREMNAAGYDFLKIYNGLSRDAFFGIAGEAKRIGIPIAGEVPDAVLPGEAARAGIRSFEHLWNLFEACVPGAYGHRDTLRGMADAPSDRKRAVQDARDTLWLRAYDTGCATALVEELRVAGTWQTPTLAINRNYATIDSPPALSDPRRAWVPRVFQAEWDRIRSGTLADYGAATAQAWRARYQAEADLVRRFADAGVGILAGSDATDWEPFIYPGASLHDELALLVEAGLTPAQALRAATSGPADFLGRSDIGDVAPGKLADLVLLDADPLADIRNVGKISAVVFDGQFQSRAQLDSLIAEAVRLARQWPDRR